MALRGLRTLLFSAALVPAAGVVFAAAPAIQESARQIPLACDVDIVVVGGTSGGVAAAAAAAQHGATVFLAAPRPH